MSNQWNDAGPAYGSGYDHSSRSYNPPVTPASLLSRTGEGVVGMGAVTPEVWNDILMQMQKLVVDNEKLRKALESNNHELQKMLAKRKDNEKAQNEVAEAQKLYWDARVSVLGFKAKIMKLTGERDQLLTQQSSVSTESSSLKELEKEKEQLRMEKITMEESNRNFKKQLQQTDEELQKWREHVQKMSSDIQALHTENSQLKLSYEERIAELQQDIQRISQQPVPKPRTMLKSDPELISKYEKEKEDLIVQLRMAQSQIEIERKNREAAEMKRTRSNEEIAQLKHQRDSLRSQLNEMELLKKEFDTKQQRHIQQYEREIRTLKQQLEQQPPPTLEAIPSGGPAGGATIRLRKQLNEYHGKVKVLTDENQALRQDMEVMDTNMKLLNSEKIKLQNQSHQLNEEISTLRQRLDEVGDSNQDQLHELERQNATLKDDNTYLQDQIQNEKEKIHQLEVRLSQKESQLQQQLQSNESTSSSWEQYIDEMEKEMERVQGELKALRDKNQGFQTENHQLMTERNRAVEEQGRLKKKLEQKQDNCKEYLEQAQMWKEQFESAQRDFELERNVREKEAQAVQALRQNRDSLQKEVDELRRRVTQQQSDLANYQDPDFVGGPMTEPLGGRGVGSPSYQPSSGEQRRGGYSQQHHFGDQRGLSTHPRHSGEQNYPHGHVEGSRHPIEKESPPIPQREQVPGYGGDVYNPPARHLGEQGYRHPTQESPPLPRERGNLGYNQTDRPTGDQGYRPLPQEGFPPRQTGGGGLTGPVAGIGHFQRTDRASGGGEILGQHFQQRPRQNVTAQEYRHQVTPKYENIRPGQPYGGNQFPPPDPQPWQQPIQGGVVLPGEIPNLAKPSMSCPICNRADFATQTELEMHCAKCD